MLVRSSVSCVLALAMVGLTLSAGCSQSTPPPAASPAESAATPAAVGDYNPHDVPITEEQKQQLRQQASQFPQAIAVIKELRNSAEEETRNGIPEDPHQVHQALDKADLVFQWLPEIARDSGVPKDRWEEVTTTANDLRTLFEKVHQNIDERKEPDFASVAAEIDQKIAGLGKIAENLTPAKTEAQP